MSDEVEVKKVPPKLRSPTAKHLASLQEFWALEKMAAAGMRMPEPPMLVKAAVMKKEQLKEEKEEQEEKFSVQSKLDMVKKLKEEEEEENICVDADSRDSSPHNTKRSPSPAASPPQRPQPNLPQLKSDVRLSFSVDNILAPGRRFATPLTLTPPHAADSAAAVSAQHHIMLMNAAAAAAAAAAAGEAHQVLLRHQQQQQHLRQQLELQQQQRLQQEDDKCKGNYTF